MTPLQMLVFLQEVSTSADMAVALRQNFLRLVEDDEERQKITVWLMLQAALMHYGMVSKFLFPTHSAGQNGKLRAQALRAELCVTNDSALNNRDARNALEHFDERLDKCIQTPDAGILQLVVETRADIAIFMTERWVFRRVYIVAEDTMIMEGPSTGPRVELPMSDIFEELERLAGFAEDRLTGKFRVL